MDILALIWAIVSKSGLPGNVLALLMLVVFGLYIYFDKREKSAKNKQEEQDKEEYAAYKIKLETNHFASIKKDMDAMGEKFDKGVFEIERKVMAIGTKMDAEIEHNNRRENSYIERFAKLEVKMDNVEKKADRVEKKVFNGGADKE
jgi:hypothetical protein